MVRAILEGRKTQTRRAVKPQPPADQTWVSCLFRPTALFQWSDEPKPEGSRACVRWPAEHGIACPYGAVGDRLWVREPWYAHWMYNDVPPRLARSGVPDLRATDNRWFLADGPQGLSNNMLPRAGYIGRYRHARFMPRWASRINLEVTGVRVERLQEISEEDAVAEGIERNDMLDPLGPCKWRVYGEEHTGTSSPRHSYESLWESINGPESWAENPWVWCISFKRVPE